MRCTFKIKNENEVYPKTIVHVSCINILQEILRYEKSTPRVHPQVHLILSSLNRLHQRADMSPIGNDGGSIGDPQRLPVILLRGSAHKYNHVERST